MAQQYYVYCHINKINGKKYIGITSNPPVIRWGSNGINYRSCTCFYNAIKKYGWNNFEHLILHESLTEDQAQQLERFYILIYQTMAPNGYNLTSGGEIKKEISEETRQRLIDSHRGIKYSEETRKHMSESRKGHPGYNRIPIWMCDKETHERIKWFPSSLDAEKFLGKKNTSAHIRHVCRGERPSAYGYFWEYDQDGRDDLSHN